MTKKRLIQLAVLLVPTALLGFLALQQQPHSVTAQSDGDCRPGFASERQWPLTDFCNNNVDFSSIISGGPPKDGIPAVTDPAMESLNEAADWLSAQSPVIALEIDGDARAYPQAILMWHEIANDTVADTPVAVTYCPLCNSSIVFDRNVAGQTLEFGVSGFLRNSDMVMYDRETESWWQQFTGEGIVGEFNGTLLDIIPSQVISFERFREQYPDGLVMSRDTGFSRSYGRNPYQGYDSLSQPFLFDGEVDPRLPAMEHVLAGTINDAAIAYPFSVLADDKVVNDSVGGEPVVAVWQGGVASALDTGNIDDGRDIGTALLYSRTLGEQTLTFTQAGDFLVDEETGTRWNFFGEAVEGELEGEQLRQLVAAPHFWFAWAAFHPETEVYEAS